MNNYDYGLIGNCTSAALVSKDGSIDWLCLPFFDSPSLFAKLLDEHQGGYFKINGVGATSVTQRYVPNTAILKTTYHTPDGAFDVMDYMPRFKTESGQYYCPSEIHRDIRVISGKPKITVELLACPNYALSPAEARLFPGYMKLTSRQGQYNSFYVYSNLDFERLIQQQPLELTCETSYVVLSYHEKLTPMDAERIYVEYEKTKSYWLGWVHKTKFPKAYRDLVIRSIITLKLLMFQRSGAVVAAPTTSLPEIIGGERNWDYRYCWIRDAAMIIDLYARLGHSKSANGFLTFVLNRMLLKHEHVTVMYGINGEKTLDERSLDHLAGYAGSRPVRIGNAAYLQQQNDLYGELIETIYSYLSLNPRPESFLTEEIWTVVRSLVNKVKSIWQDPDAGIWERRGSKQHYVHSKLMNWVAMDRAARIANLIGNSRYAVECFRLAREIKNDILTEGWNDHKQAFTAFYGSEHMDAANLLMLHYGFLDKQDPRMVSTVHACYRELVRDNLTLRYVDEDDFGTPENAFIVCTFWMINALYLVGEKDKARAMFDNILSCANLHGLLAEDVEIKSKRLIGNFPQGYSHLALIQTVLLLETNYTWTDINSIIGF